jgi:hypothetical protein
MHLNLSTLQSPVLHLDVSTKQWPELHLDVSGQLEPLMCPCRDIQNSVHEKVTELHQIFSYYVTRNFAKFRIILGNFAWNTKDTEVQKTYGIPCRQNSAANDTSVWIGFFTLCYIFFGVPSPTPTPFFSTPSRPTTLMMAAPPKN